MKRLARALLLLARRRRRARRRLAPRRADDLQMGVRRGAALGRPGTRSESRGLASYTDADLRRIERTAAMQSAWGRNREGSCILSGTALPTVQGLPVLHAADGADLPPHGLPEDHLHLALHVRELAQRPGDLRDLSARRGREKEKDKSGVSWSAALETSSRRPENARRHASTHSRISFRESATCLPWQSLSNYHF